MSADKILINRKIVLIARNLKHVEELSRLSLPKYLQSVMKFLDKTAKQKRLL